MKNPFELNNREIIEVYKNDIDMLVEYVSYDLYNNVFYNNKIDDVIAEYDIRPQTYNSNDRRMIIAGCTDMPTIVQLFPTLNLSIALDLITIHAAEFVDKAVEDYVNKRIEAHDNEQIDTSAQTDDQTDTSTHTADNQ